MNLDHLKQAAAAATQGPWSVLAGHVVHEEGEGYIIITPPLNRRDNAAHIATFDPPTVQALITRIEQAEHRVRRYKALAETRLETIQRVRDARANHPEIPECDRYTDVIRKAKAEAWQEGYWDRYDFHVSHGLRGTETNPYTEES